MKSLFPLLIWSLLVNSNPSTGSRHWCNGVIAHGQVVRDLQENLFVMDDWLLRKFTDHNLRNWYKTKRSPVCILKSPDSTQYRYGSEINFRPDQDLQTPTLFKSVHSNRRFIWIRGRLHRVTVSPQTLGVKDQHYYRLSRLQQESLPAGPPITPFTILEGTIIKATNKTFIATRNGLRPISKPRLKLLNLHYVSSVHLTAKHREAKPFQLINRHQWPTNILIRGSHPKRIYLLRNHKRYYLWSQTTLHSRGWYNKPIRKLSDDELYLIPFAGNIY